MEEWRVLLNMSEMKMNYANEDVKKKFNSLICKNYNVMLGMEKIANTFGNVCFSDIFFIKGKYLLKVLGNVLEIDVQLDYLGNIENIEYTKCPEQKFIRNNRSVIVKKDTVKKEYQYLDETNDFTITLYLQDGMENISIIDELLDENHPIGNIKDIFCAIKSIMDLNQISLRIKSNTDDDVIIYDHGVLIKYLYIRKDQNRTFKEYLGDDNELYEEEIFTKELEKSKQCF